MFGQRGSELVGKGVENPRKSRGGAVLYPMRQDGARCRIT